MRSFDDFDKSFNRMRRFVTFFIGLVFTLVVLFWIGAAVLAYKAVDAAGAQDWNGGVKPVIEKLWCGKPGCLSQTDK